MDSRLLGLDSFYSGALQTLAAEGCGNLASNGGQRSV